MQQTKRTTHGVRRKHGAEKENEGIRRQRGEELTVLLSQRVKNEMVSSFFRHKNS